MHIAVVANGDLAATYHRAVLAVLNSVDLVIAADGGLTHCAQLGVWPNTLVGDLDSAADELVEQARLRGTEVVAHPRDKDATDLELALEHARAAGATAISVVAAFGGRVDHELATIGLLAARRWTPIAVGATDGRRRLWVVHDAIDLSLDVGSTISLVPIHGDAQGVTTTGLQWPLAAEALPAGSTRGVSNVVAAQNQHISVTSGTLLVINDVLPLHD